MTQDNNDEKKQIEARRYRRANIGRDTLIGVLGRRLSVCFPQGARIVEVYPNERLYPSGISVILYHPDYQIVSPECEPPDEINIRIEHRSESKTLNATA